MGVREGCKKGARAASGVMTTPRIQLEAPDKNVIRNEAHKPRPKLDVNVGSLLFEN